MLQIKDKLTWYKLRNQLKDSVIEYLTNNNGEYDHDDIHELCDSIIPIYTADILTVAISNLHLATCNDCDIGYKEDATAIERIQTNMFCELNEYLHANILDWADEVKETLTEKAEG